MKSTLAARIRADNGGTSYNDAFALATKDNPRARRSASESRFASKTA